MRLLLTTHLYRMPDRPDFVNEIEALHDFAREWVRTGHEVSVFHAYMERESGAGRLKLLLPKRRLVELSLDGVRVLRLELRFPKAIDPLRRRYMAYAAARLSKAAAIEPPDLILSHFPIITEGLPESLPYACPRVAVLHSTDIKRLKKTALWGGYAGVGFRSRRIRADFLREGSWSGPEFLVLSGAPPVPEGAAREGADGTVRFLYAGKLIERKRVDLTLRALSMLPPEIDWRFTVVGEGPEEATLKRLAAALGIEGRVAFAGRLGREEAISEMARHDAFVMPSSGETFGLAYLEAMAQGRIAVGTAGEGIDGVIEDGANGFLVRPDAESLRAALTRIARMAPAERAAIGRVARATAKAMSAENMARAYLENAASAAGIRA